MPKLTDSFYGNELQTWLIAVGIALATMIVLWVLERVVIARVAKLTTKTSTIIDDVVIGAVRKTKLIYLFIIGVFVGSKGLDLKPRIDDTLWKVTIIATLIQAGIWASTALQIWLENYRKGETDGGHRMTMNALSFIARLVLWATILLLILDNLGVDITALVAGLGIGGVAIALAVQNILGDLFASLSIVLDKPFVLGDFVIVGDLMGSVENIGIKTTRVRSLSGEQLVFSNNDLLTSRIRNFGRMQERRVVFKLGVTYQTPAEKLEGIPGIIREAIEARDKTRFDRSHFASYGDFSLDFETVYYVLSADYNLYMDIQQAINLAIFRRFADEGIEFAYPTQTLFLEKEQAEETAS
ncbi:MAG: mechanosensitive ion channel family protein [Polyangiales bacterium]